MTQITTEMKTSATLLFDKVETESQKADQFVLGQNKNIAEVQQGLNTLKDSLKVYHFAKLMFGSVLGQQELNAQGARVDEEGNPRGMGSI